MASITLHVVVRRDEITGEMALCTPNDTDFFEPLSQDSRHQSADDTSSLVCQLSGKLLGGHLSCQEVGDTCSCVQLRAVEGGGVSRG